MKVSYNWLKWYLPDLPSKLVEAGIPEVPTAEKLADIITYHIAEVESVETRKDGDSIFDIKILPNRAHDLLSHQGVARELASLLNIKFADPTPKYKIPQSKTTALKIEVQTDKCRRYMGRIARGVKVGPSPEWVVKHLESIGQRSVNNLVDASNIVMFNCGQPTHIFDLKNIKGKIIVRLVQDGERLVTLDDVERNLTKSDMVIADAEKILAIAGVKGGKIDLVSDITTDVIFEVANFDPTSVRKTAQSQHLFTESRKRFENDLSPELAAYGMIELSALISEMCPDAIFEDIVDVYPKKQEERKVSFSVDRISKILGLEVSASEVEDIFKKYLFKYVYEKGVFEIIVPPMRLDLTIEEDMAEEIGRILGYDKVKPVIPKIDLPRLPSGKAGFKPRVNENYAKIVWARNKLLSEGYSEVMNTTFTTKGEVSVLASASDKNFLRTNLSDGLKESLKLNKINAPLLGLDEVKIFEIGTVFRKSGEEMRVAYGDKKEVKEMTLDEFCKDMSSEFKLEPRNYDLETKFKMWSLFPFIARDVAVWAPEGVSSSEVLKVIKDDARELVVSGPELFDEFKKDGKISYAFRLVFQSYDRTLTDAEVNEIMDKINEKIKEKGWEVR